MPMKKSEMEEHKAAYHLLVSGARSAIAQKDFSTAIGLATKSWKYVDGMMQFERKYEAKEFDSVEGIDIVLAYAPLVFDFESLNELGELLKSQRRIDKHASDDLAGKLDHAKGSMHAARHLWNQLEAIGNRKEGDINSDVRSELEQHESILGLWEEMGITTRGLQGTSVTPRLCTRMDDQVAVKCPSCGVTGHASKSKILDEVKCPKCHNSVAFVILASGN
jgi:hypothetical protein